MTAVNNFIQNYLSNLYLPRISWTDVIEIIIIAFVLANNLPPTDLKLFSSIVLAICLSLPAAKEWYRDFINRRSQKTV